MHNRKSYLLGSFLTVLALVIAFLPIGALAGSSSGGGYSLNFPDGYYSCDPSDKITVSGTPQGWWVFFKFYQYDAKNSVWVQIGDAWIENTDGGDVSASFPYEGRTGNFLVTARVTDALFGAPIAQFTGKWWVKCDTPPPPDGEGCTPGFWKNHTDLWDIDSSTLFSDYFGIGSAITFGAAVDLKGGQDNALMRHATAGALNIASGLSYGFTEAELIALVQDAFASGDFNTAKNQIEAANELYCPLN